MEYAIGGPLPATPQPMVCINCHDGYKDHWALDWYFVGMLEDSDSINQCAECTDCYSPEFKELRHA